MAKAGYGGGDRVHSIFRVCVLLTFFVRSLIIVVIILGGGGGGGYSRRRSFGAA